MTRCFSLLQFSLSRCCCLFLDGSLLSVLLSFLAIRSSKYRGGTVVQVQQEDCFHHRTRTLTNGDPGIEIFFPILVNAALTPMNTRSKVNLTATSINDLLNTCNKRNDSDREQIANLDPQTATLELPSDEHEKPNTSTSPSRPVEDRSSPTVSPRSTMSDNDDIHELQEIQRKQSEVEERFLQRIPMFIPAEDANTDEFLSAADIIFTRLRYSDEDRLRRIKGKLHESLHPWLTDSRCKDWVTWEDFKNDLRSHLEPRSLHIHPDTDTKPRPTSFSLLKDWESKTSALDLLLQQVMPFTGEGNARQWFILLDSKFSELKTPLMDRLDILPHFLSGDAMLWFSMNKYNMPCYTDFCHGFAREYLQTKQTSGQNVLIDHTNGLRSSRPIPLIIDNSSILALQSPQREIPGITVQGIPSPNALSVNSSMSVLSPTISKALIDKFVKDPIKFSGGKEHVTSWIEEIEQQFKTMYLNDVDKLNLIHICLKNDAYQWYRQHKDQFVSWEIFLEEVRKSFTSNLQRDLAFDKLKHYHQTTHQTVSQYYTTMIKLIKQADPLMNESTKVQYLMNGLLASLSTETRRNYPKTAAEFLAKAKVAEEITAGNSIRTSNLTITDDSHSPSNPSSSKFFYGAAANEYREYRQPYIADHRNRNNPHSSNNHDQRGYVSRISHPPSAGPYVHNQATVDAPRPSNQAQRSNPQSTIPRYDSYSHRSSGPSQDRNMDQHARRCSHCGSPNHNDRQCDHFEEGGQ